MDWVIERRRSDRHPVVLAAQSRTSSGMRDTAEISDISPEGCCITTDSLFIKVGARLMIRPEGMEGLTGTVRWIDGFRAGIEFDEALYAPVVEHLAARCRRNDDVQQP
jgi:hypothetical protein